MAVTAAPLRRLPLMAAFPLAMSLPAAAEQEPYGQTMTGWRFTQDIVNGRAVCRAYSPDPTAGVIIQRRGDGQFFMSVPVRNVPQGRYEEASFEVGRTAEPVNATADGNRVYLAVDDHLIALAVPAGGFRWAVNGRRQVGTVQFNMAFGPAIDRLRQCTRANGGR